MHGIGKMILKKLMSLREVLKIKRGKFFPLFLRPPPSPPGGKYSLEILLDSLFPPPATAPNTDCTVAHRSDPWGHETYAC